MQELIFVSTLVSTFAAVIACIAAVYAMRRDRREITNEDKKAFSERVMEAIEKSNLIGQMTAAARQEFLTMMRDRMQVEFQQLVTRNEFISLGASLDKRLSAVEGQFITLLQMTGTIGGKIDTLLQLRENE